MRHRSDQIEGCLAVIALLAVLKPINHTLRHHPLTAVGALTLVALIVLEYPQIKRRVSIANRQWMAWLLGILWAIVGGYLFIHYRGEDALELATYQVYLSLGAPKWAFIPVALASYLADGGADVYVLAMLLINEALTFTKLASISSKWWWWGVSVMPLLVLGRWWTAYAMLAAWVALRTLN